jgi:hypothetical protein
MVAPLGGAGGKVWQRPPLKLKTSMAGPLGVLELEVRQHPPPKEDVDGGPPGGARAGDPGAQRLQSPPLGQGGEWLQKPRTNTQIVVRTYFTLTQVGHFC